MHRRLTAALAALSLVALVGATTVAAPPSGLIRTRATHAEAGGKILVRAKVIRPDTSAAFSASAIVTLDDGPVAVDLKKAGRRSFLARKQVPVPADETLGCKTVEITVTYGAATETFTHQVQVVALGTDPETIAPCPA